MAAAATKKQQNPPVASATATTVVDPKFEWAEKAGSYVLRLPLPGFRKDDFRVQVDGGGRLTVRGSRPAPAGQSSLYKVFQLPSTASLDDIAGRFEAGVLTLTVPKRASSDGVGAGAAPTSIEEIKRKQPGVAKEERAKAPPGKELDEKKVAAAVAKPKEEIAKEDALKKPVDKATKKAAPQQKQQEEQPKSSKQEQQKPSLAPAAKKEEDVKPRAPQSTAAAAPPQPKPEAVTGADKAKAAVAPESLSERVRRRGEEEHANAAPMAAAKRARTDGEKKAIAPCGGWKERVQGELKVLTDMKWVDGMVEAARKNKEVVAIGIAAFSLGFLVSHKLFRK